MTPQFSRRTVLRGMLTIAGGAALSACGLVPTVRTDPTPAPRTPNADFVPDLEIRLRAAPAEVAILPGRATNVWSYQGQVLNGDPASLQSLPGSYLGPTIHVRRGQKVRIHFENALPGQDTLSIIHWHGLTIPSDQDAHPRYAVRPGQTYTYEFTVVDRAGTYWYHPHPDMQTGRQVYQGLAGLFVVSDDEERAAKLPEGSQDISLVIQDRTFDSDNQLVYAAGEAMDGSMDYLMGFLGERVLVNGRVDATIDVATRAYRLRLLNGSNARTYKLGWSDGPPLTVIATDGGLLERPLKRPYVTLAPGERVELWANFRDFQVGSELRLESLSFSGAEGSQGTGEQAMGHAGAANAGHGSGGAHGGDADHGSGGAHGGDADHGSGGAHGGGHAMDAAASNMTSAPPQGAPLTILRLRVTEQIKSEDVLPTRLSTISRYQVEESVNRDQPRTFTITQPEMRWELNGRIYEPHTAAADETVRRGELEVWELVNALNEGDTMHPQGMLHPFHIHGLQFQVLERQVLPELSSGWQSVSAGYVDEGWKDTVLLMPGERVKLLLRFSEYIGTYMLHCHILEHEDMGLMRNIEVVA